MKYAIEILTNRLNEINKPIPEDTEGDAVLHNRQKSDLKLALKILHEFKQNTKVLNRQKAQNRRL